MSRSPGWILFTYKSGTGGPVVKNLLTNVWDMGSIPGLGTETPHATGQLGLLTTTTEPAYGNEGITARKMKQNKYKKLEDLAQ